MPFSKKCPNPFPAILGKKQSSFVHQAEGGGAKGLSGLSTKKRKFKKIICGFLKHSKQTNEGLPAITYSFVIMYILGQTSMIKIIYLLTKMTP